MFIKINYKHLESTDGIENITFKKSEKLNKYFNGRINLEWTFTVEKQNQIARCHLTGAHNLELFAEAATDTLYSSIDEVVAKLERQVRKLKEEVKDHHHRGIKSVIRNVA